MKANELMIGNAFGFYKPLETELQNGIVRGVYYDKEEVLWFVQSAQYADINLNGIKPIPLTPEILEKCGFDIDMNNFNWNAYKDFTRNGFEHYVALRYNKKIGWFFRDGGSPIYFLHQLQNLYFALTGVELEVKI